MATIPSRNSILGSLERARILITNSQANPTISALLAQNGYDAAAMSIGQALYDKAYELTRIQQREVSEQRSASTAIETAWEQAKSSYMPILELARVALKHSNTVASLDLYGRRKGALLAWIEQAKRFYENVVQQPDDMAKLAKLNITPERIAAALADVNALAAAHNAHLQEQSDNQKATELRDAAIDELDDWVEDFVQVAKVALRDDRQLLEALGIRA
ncbi:hypothetical protein F8S13_25430 [Chloroflexia bacterium SDU3-3]|nr:hypothetical protein F8S13_25430 [Chloroflexia bacterium SDU3-3]